jgi:hypothetical protein
MRQKKETRNTQRQRQYLKGEGGKRSTGTKPYAVQVDRGNDERGQRRGACLSRRSDDQRGAEVMARGEQWERGFSGRANRGREREPSRR